MKISSKMISFISVVTLTMVMVFFQNFTSALLSHEVDYISGSAVRLSEIVAATSGTKDTKRVEIRKGEIAYLDKSIDVDQLIINGELHCDNSLAAANIEIKAKVIYVNGIFQCGISTERYSKSLVISLKDSAYTTKSGAYRGLLVNPAGKLILNGLIHGATWTKLAATAKAGDNFIKLATAVKWKIGEEIVIAPTSYNPSEGETFFIKSISGTTVYLDGVLKNQHWGLTEKYGTVVMDQRGEVGNLTRNILIQADESAAVIAETDTPGAELGGHVMVMKGGSAYVDGAEFYRMGQAGVMARYPFHWHVVGDAKGQYIKNSSIHRSFQRCITVHGTNNSLVQNNVCYSFKGHGYFLEDGNEIGNTLTGNLGIWAQHPNPSKTLLASDNKNAAKSGVVRDRFPAVSVFWISNPENVITNNTSAGSVGVGFWNSFPRIVQAYNASTGRLDGPIIDEPYFRRVLNFSNNTAHSGEVGMNWDGIPAPISDKSMSMNNPNNPNDQRLITVFYSPQYVPVLSGLAIFKNKETGIYFRGKTVMFDKLVMADNGTSLFFAYNTIVKNSAIIGRSLNHGPVEEKYLYSSPTFLGQKEQIGMKLYDGPFEAENLTFYSFSTAKDYRTISAKSYDVTSRPFATVSGAQEFVNLAIGIKFSPEPFHRTFNANGHGGDKLRDLDGSLTGKPSILLSKSSLSITKDCVDGGQKHFGFWICPATLSDTVVSMYSNRPNDYLQPLIAGRADDETKVTRTVDTWDAVIAARSGMPFFSVLNSTGYIYNMLVQPRSLMGGMGVASTSDKRNNMTAPIKIIGHGSECVLPYAKRAASLAELNKATSSSYFSSGNDFYIRLGMQRAQSDGWFFTTSPHGRTDVSQADNFPIDCKKDVMPEARGAVSVSGLVMNGWACDFAKPLPSEVQVYVGGPKGKGTLLTKFLTDRLSLPSVAFACNGAGKHNFSVALTQAMVSKNAGKQVYIYSSPKAGLDKLMNSQVLTIACPTATTCKLVASAPSAIEVRFGAGTMLASKTFAAGSVVRCSNQIFGDPAIGSVKGCFSPSGVKYASEGERFTFTCSTPASCIVTSLVKEELKPLLVKYGIGVGHTLIEKTFAIGSTVRCSTAEFGKDPAPFVQKYCLNALGETIAKEGEDFTFVCINNEKCTISKIEAPRPVVIKYGMDGKYSSRTYMSGTSVLCSNTVFGDPLPGVHKACFTEQLVRIAEEDVVFLAK